MMDLRCLQEIFSHFSTGLFLLLSVLTFYDLLYLCSFPCIWTLGNENVNISHVCCMRKHRCAQCDAIISSLNICQGAPSPLHSLLDSLYSIA